MNLSTAMAPLRAALALAAVSTLPAAEFAQDDAPDPHAQENSEREWLLRGSQKRSVDDGKDRVVNTRAASAPSWLNEARHEDTAAAATVASAAARSASRATGPGAPASVAHEQESGSSTLPWLVLVLGGAAVAVGYALVKRHGATPKNGAPHKRAPAAAPQPKDGPMVVQMRSRFAPKPPTSAPAKPAAAAAKKAFTIVEVMIAATVLAVCLLTMLSTVTTLSSADKASKETVVVQQLAQMMAERIQGGSWSRLGVPEEPWSWYRRFRIDRAPTAAANDLNPFSGLAGAWRLWDPVAFATAPVGTIGNPTDNTAGNTWLPGTPGNPPPPGQLTYYSPPITLSGDGNRSIFINKGQLLVDTAGVSLSPNVPIQEIIVVDCALQDPPAPEIAKARAKWAGDPAYTAVTPVRGLGFFRESPALRNLRIYLEYYNQFPKSQPPRSIFDNISNRAAFQARLSDDSYRLGAPDPNTTAIIHPMESPDDLQTVGLNDVTGAIGIHLLIMWDSATDAVPDATVVHPNARLGTRKHELIFERRK